MKMYVIFVKTGRETAVFRRLLELGFDAILPRKSQKVIFENYVFLRCDLTAKICDEITKFRDVYCILGWNIPDSVPFLTENEQLYIEKLADGGNYAVTKNRFP